MARMIITQNKATVKGGIKVEKNNEEKMLIPVWEMGKRLGVSRKTAYELSRSEGFPVLRIGRRVLIPVKQLEEWVAANLGGTVA